MTAKRKKIMAYDFGNDNTVELTQARYDNEIKALNRFAAFRSEVKRLLLNTESEAERAERLENEKILREVRTAREAAE